jgi:Peptidase_C39 like family
MIDDGVLIAFTIHHAMTLPQVTLLCGTLITALPLALEAQEKKPALPAPTAFPGAPKAAGDPLDILTGSAGTWKVTAEQFEKDLRVCRPDWLDPGKTQARIANTIRKETGELHKIIGGQLPVHETTVNFADSLVQRVQFSIYNRGDAGDISPDNYKRLIELSKTAITSAAGNPGQDRGKVTSAVLTKGWVWKNADSQFLLESSLKRQAGEDRPEFIRLIIVPAASVPKAALGSKTAAGGSSAATATLGSLKANVTKNEKGDVFIANVPMVDQGQKGYCVVATAERVMRYYGAEVDQHEMAQMADSSADGGTSPTKMTEALDRIDSKFKLRLKRLLPWTERGYMDLIKDYNRAARINKTREITNDESYSVGFAYQEMDADTLKKARATTSAMEKFKKMVRSSIDPGVPLMWSVHLGLFKEGDLPQSGGGHMRLIIGYNDTTNEILFSDSWGPGHELKRMPADEAWTITSGIYGMEPKAK